MTASGARRVSAVSPLARSLASRAGMVATALAALVIVLLTVGVPAVASLAVDSALRERAAGDGRTELAVVQVRATAEQPNTVAESAIIAGAHPVPVLATQVFATAPLTAAWETGGGELVLAAVRADPGTDLLGEALGALEAGRMPQSAPSGTVEAVIDAPSAAQLGIDVGAVVTIDGRDPISIVGIWAPSRDGLRLLEAAGLARGALLTTTDAVFVGDSDPYERWILRLDPEAMSADALTGSGTLAERVSAALEERAGIPSAGIVVDDAISAELAQLAVAVAAADGILIGFIAVGIALAVVAMVQVGAMVAADRAAELALVRSRGASRWRTGRVAAAVYGVAALGGGAAGAVGVLVVATVGGAMLGGSVVSGVAGVESLALVLVPFGTAALAAVAIGWACGSGVRDPASPRRMIERVRMPFAVVTVVVLAVLATVGLWSGSGPISAAAPALALVAATAILLMIAAPIAAAIGRRRVEPTASLVGARRMARRPTRFSAALAITAIQVGIVVLAAATAGSTAAIAGQARALDTGASVRAIGGATATDLGAAVLVDDLTWGDREIALVAMTGLGAASAVEPVSGLVDPVVIATALGDTAPGIGVGDGRVEIAADASGAAVLWLADASGTLARIAVNPDDPDPTALPEGTDWRMLAIDAKAGQAGQWQLASLTADGAEIDLDGWSSTDEEVVVTLADGAADGMVGGILDVAAPPRTAGDGAPGPALAITVRLLPSEPIAVTAVIDEAVANAGGLGEGDPFVARVAGSGRQLEAVVAGVVPAIPGAGGAGGVMLELRSLLASQLRTTDVPPQPNERWIGAADAAAARDIDWPPDSRLLDSGAGVHERIVGVAIAAAWASAALALALAVIAVAATIAQRIRLDGPEAAAMVAMGMNARGIRTAFMRELVPLTIVAAGVGLLAGLVASAATAPIVAWRAVPGSPGLIDPVLRADPIGLAVALVVVAAALVLLISRGAAAAGRSASIQVDGGARW